MLSRVAQIVYTATRAPDVDAVLFTMEGEPLTVLGGEGLLLEEPQARSGYHDLLPEIAIESPVWGGRSTDELVLAGTADLDTPSFTVVLVDAVGTIVAEEEVEVERDGDSRGRFGLEIGDLEVWPVSVVVYDSEGDGRQVAVLQYPLSP